MGRDDIAVGIGGEGGILQNGTILPNVGGYLPLIEQGKRRYIPLGQPTAQQVLIDKISAGPVTVLITGAHTNFAIFLMSNPHLKKNVKHIYIMGGGVRSSNPTGCCPKTTSSSCMPRQCGDRGNVFTDYNTNPYAEFNIFWDPFAAYQVLKQPHQAGRFNLTTEFPHYREVTYKPDFQNKRLGKPVVFDMDMSAGDFLTLFYLLKVPVEVTNLKVL
ncbi:unnamed protein product [Lupinus luteus]|uniref:Inosine/uridine-preferring nucleoside hydrolase domain-containing protein n=1 Tax=Lupinus luteus TaxID=3873 RepID=A0AAV1WDW9_LUPLU